MSLLKNHVFGGANQEAEQSYRQIIDLVLQGLAEHVVKADQLASARFRADLDRFVAAMNSGGNPADLIPKAGELVSILEKYFTTSAAWIQKNNTDLLDVISLLTQGIGKIANCSEPSTTKFREIERALLQGGAGHGKGPLKAQLRTCLDIICEETQRQRADNQVAIAKLKEDLGASQHRKDVDSITGLPSKKDAEAALRLAINAPEGTFIMIAVASRVNAVNARFGYAAGDRMLAACAKHFRSGLSSSDQLYRWQGPAFPAILSRDKRIDQVRSEIRQFADAPVQENIQVGSRAVPIQVSTNWSIIQPNPPFEAILRKIEAFTAAQVPRDYA